MIEKVKKELGHSADCDCRGCTNLSVKFGNTSQIIHAADRALTDIGITQVNGKDIAYSALKIFLQRSYRRQTVRA